MENKFNFCPNCGCKNIQNIDMRCWRCAECGFVLYNNVAAAVAVIVLDKSGSVLFEVRAKEPKQGMLCLPGGFVEPGETPEQACIRECHEELGFEPVELKYMAGFPNTYDYKDIRYKTCDMFFTAVLPDDAEFNLQKTEVAQVQKHFIRNLQDLSELPLAFDSARNALEFWVKNKQ